MSSWTLRPQATGGVNGSFNAADRAARYVRRHGWQFHGVGVQDAVAQLEDITGTRTLHGPVSARAARDRLAVSLNIPGPLRLEWEDPSAVETCPVCKGTFETCTCAGGGAEEPYGYCPGCKGPEAAPCLGTHATWAICKECA